MYILAFDYGTSSIKVSLFDRKMKCVKSTSVDYRYRVANNDWVTLEAETLYQSLVTGVAQLSEYLQGVEVIAFDTFSPSLVLMDGNGNALYPVITHLDRRAKAQSKRIKNQMGAECYQRITGIFPFTGGASITTMMWFRENMRDTFNKTCMLGHLNTFIYKKLTGVWATDPVNASMTGAYETITEKGWSADILQEFGIPENKLPDIHQPGTILGRLLPEAARDLGLKAGIPVALGSNDAATAHAGAGNSCSGDVLNISGSSEMVSILSDRPVINSKYYLRKSVYPGLWQLYATTMGGFALEWAKKELFSGMDRKEFYDLLIPGLLARGMDDSMVKFLPYMAGDRQSLKRKTGAFTGLTLDSTREDMLLSILYGINEPIRKTLLLGSKFLKINSPLKITGGLTRTQGYPEFKAKILGGYKVEAREDCTITGAATLALKALNGG
jgi:sugar (pentulose or hexulose) kinase